MKYLFANFLMATADFLFNLVVHIQVTYLTGNIALSAGYFSFSHLIRIFINLRLKDGNIFLKSRFTLSYLALIQCMTIGLISQMSLNWSLETFLFLILIGINSILQTLYRVTYNTSVMSRVSQTKRTRYQKGQIASSLAACTAPAILSFHVDGQTFSVFFVVMAIFYTIAGLIFFSVGRGEHTLASRPAVPSVKYFTFRELCREKPIVFYVATCVVAINICLIPVHLLVPLAKLNFPEAHTMDIAILQLNFCMGGFLGSLLFHKFKIESDIQKSVGSIFVIIGLTLPVFIDFHLGFSVYASLFIIGGMISLLNVTLMGAIGSALKERERFAAFSYLENLVLSVKAAAFFLNGFTLVHFPFWLPFFTGSMIMILVSIVVFKGRILLAH